MSRVGLFLFRVVLFGGGFELLDVWLDDDGFDVVSAVGAGLIFAVLLTAADIARDRWDLRRARRPPTS